MRASSSLRKLEISSSRMMKRLLRLAITLPVSSIKTIPKVAFLGTVDETDPSPAEYIILADLSCCNSVVVNIRMAG